MTDQLRSSLGPEGALPEEPLYYADENPSDGSPRWAIGIKGVGAVEYFDTKADAQRAAKYLSDVERLRAIDQRAQGVSREAIENWLVANDLRIYNSSPRGYGSLDAKQSAEVLLPMVRALLGAPEEETKP